MKEVQQRAREWESAVELTQKAADMEKGNMSMVIILTIEATLLHHD